MEAVLDSIVQPCPNTTDLWDQGQRMMPVPHIGLVIGTCGTVPYVHLQLEQVRRMYGDSLPVLVVNDGDGHEHDTNDLAQLCSQYEADFVYGPYLGHSTGDLRVFTEGLDWAVAHNVQILAKFSRRFVPLRPWRYELLALAEQYTYAACFTRQERETHLFRTDAIALRVDRFNTCKIMETLKEAMERAAITVHVENLFSALAKTCGGYEEWPLLGESFYATTRDAMQWRGCLPCHYGDLSRSLGLPYQDEDFAAGRLAQPVDPPPDIPATPVPTAARPGKIVMPPAREITRQREELYEARCSEKGDINKHLPKLRSLAAKCDYVTELGTRAAVSTIAFLAAQPKQLTCYDIGFMPHAISVLNLAGDTDVILKCESTLECEIADTDLLFIDTLHTYAQLTEELKRHAPKARRFLVFHDTETYGESSEDGTVPGLRAAINDYCDKTEEWAEVYHATEDNGLTVLERVHWTIASRPALVAAGAA